MKFKCLVLVLLSMWLFAACSQEPVEVTRVVEVEKPVEVTRVVEAEVTRVVNVTEEVEVTREVEVEVEVTREVEVEVTRLVEVEVTAVPTETPTPAPTNTPAPSTASNPQPTSTPSVSVQQALLQAMIDARTDMLAYGGMIDGALRSGGIDCQAVVDTYDRVDFAPTFDASGADPVVQNAYSVYLAAIDIFTTGAWDMTNNCREFLANPHPGTIGSQQWGLARQQVNVAVDTIQPAIQSLGGE